MPQQIIRAYPALIRFMLKASLMKVCVAVLIQVLNGQEIFVIVQKEALLCPTLPAQSALH
jgi:hypothetical protein